MPIRREIGLLCLCVLLALFWAGCSDSQSTPTTATVSVAVSPATASVQVGTTKQFSATVSNASNSAVNWQVNGVAGGNAMVGTISSSGLYTAPASVPTPATVTVTAVSQADSSKSGSATVTVTAPPAITVSVSPSTANVAVGATQQFTANVQNTANTAVIWQVNGVQGGNSTVGTITSGGLYTGPVSVPNPATVTVQAVSQADNTKSGSATVTITATQITVTVTPPTASVQVNGTQQFTAVVTGTSNTSVTWSTTDLTGAVNAPSNGTVSSSGLYTAPATVPSGAPTVYVMATSNADSIKTASATVTVTAAAATAHFVYVSSPVDNNIEIFSVNDTTGALTASGSASTGTGTQPAFLGMHPSGKFLYSLNKGTGNISLFSVNATTGALTSAGTATAGSGPQYMVFNSTGTFAYATCDIAGSVVGYSVNTTTGALTAVPGSPHVIAAGNRVRGLAISPDNKYLFVADRDATPNGIHIFTINSSTGALTEISGSPYPGEFLGSLIVDKSGKYLYAGAPADVVVSAYTINQSTGAISIITDYATSGTGSFVWTFDGTGAHLYGGNNTSNSIFGFNVAADGSLTMISGMPVASGVMPAGGGLHPNGKFAYVVNQFSDTQVTPGTINTYSVNATTGAFTQIGSSMPTGSNNSIGFAITP